MSDEENTSFDSAQDLRPTPEPTQSEPTLENPTPNQSSQSSGDTGQVSEANPIPVSLDEPIVEAPVPPIESVPAPEPHGPTEASPSSESAVMVSDAAKVLPNKKDQNPAPPSPSPSLETTADQREATAGQGNEPFDKTPDSAKATPGEQNKPIDLAEEIKIKQRKENLKLANEKRQNKKREKIYKVLTLFSENPKITNNEVEKLLHVSDATATRYLETLEKEGKIKQVGKTGKHTHYEKI